MPRNNAIVRRKKDIKIALGMGLTEAQARAKVDVKLVSSHDEPGEPEAELVEVEEELPDIKDPLAQGA